VLFQQRSQPRLAVRQTRAADLARERDPVYFRDAIQDRDGRPIPEQDALGVHSYGIDHLLMGRGFRHAHLQLVQDLEIGGSKPRARHNGTE